MSARPQALELHEPKNHGFRSMTRVLFALCESKQLGIHELSRRLNISIGMVQRIVATLVEAGLAFQDEESRKYLIGHAALRLGNAYLRTSGVLLQRCVAELPRLSEETGETTSVHQRVGEHRIIVAQHEVEHDLSWRSDTSRTYPLHAGAASKALLACTPPEELERLLAMLDFERYQESTPRHRAELEAQINEIRRVGFALSFGERVAGAGGVAVPVLSKTENAILAISVYGPEVRIRPALDRIIEAVRAAALRAAPPQAKDVR